MLRNDFVRLVFWLGEVETPSVNAEGSLVRRSAERSRGRRQIDRDRRPSDASASYLLPAAATELSPDFTFE